MKKSMFVMIITLVLSFALLTGCNQTASVSNSKQLASGGVLVLSVNPEIAVEYDEKGLVTGVTARNDDAKAIIDSSGNLTGQEARNAVTKLVDAIGKAGFFVEEIEGEPRQVSLEIEPGSKLPNDTFLNDLISDLRNHLNKNGWKVPINVENESDYGMANYEDTDYGPNNDGDTDYGDTDYGPNNDGDTDYDDTDYGPNNDGVTDYDDTDYGPNNDGVTDYDDGYSNYDDGYSNYDDGYSNYDDGHSNYDDGYSNYDDGGSDYDAGSDYGSDYDD